MPTNGPAADHFDYLDLSALEHEPPEDPDLDEQTNA